MREIRLIILGLIAGVFILGCKKEEEDYNTVDYKIDFNCPDVIKNRNEYTINSIIENEEEINTVELFLNGKSVEKKFTKPFSFNITFKDLMTGEHRFIMEATTKNGITINSDEKKFIFSVSLGDEYQGGIVVKTDGDGLHGIIASKSDLKGGVLGKYQYGLYNGNYQSYSMDDGLENTNKFKGKSDDNFAAIACLNLEHNGYNDWYLPAYNEMEYIKNFEDILIQYRLSNLYWTSTLRNDNTHAEIYPFGERYAYSISDLDVQKYHYVKPCRRF